MTETPVFFKKCTLCGKTWSSSEEFLADTSVKLNGYQGDIRKLVEGIQQKGLLIFTHHQSDCGTSLAIPAKSFRKEKVS